MGCPGLEGERSGEPHGNGENQISFGNDNQNGNDNRRTGLGGVLDLYRSRYQGTLTTMIRPSPRKSRSALRAVERWL